MLEVLKTNYYQVFLQDLQVYFICWFFSRFF